MLRLISSLLVGSLLFASLGLSQGTKSLAFADLYAQQGRVSFREKVPAWAWAHDQEHLATKKNGEDLWIDPIDLSEVQPVARLEMPAIVFDGAAALEAAGMERAAAEEWATGRHWAKEKGHLFQHDKGLAWMRTDGAGGAGVVLDAELGQLAPDGMRLAYVLGNDLYVLHLGTGETWRITSNGSAERFNGKLDWVYQEELYGRGRFRGFWWSPSSTHLAFLSLDESPVHSFTVVDHLVEDHFRVETEVTNYPKAGDPNPIVSLGVCQIQESTVAWMDLEKFQQDEALIVRVDWTPDGAHCLATVQNRIQNELAVVALDPNSAEGEVWLQEESDTWVARPRAPHWLADGSFLFLSERDSWWHLYRRQPDGKVVQISKGEWEVRSIEHVDEQTGEVLLETNMGYAPGNQFLVVHLDGSEPRRITQDRGSHRLSFNGDRSLFLDHLGSLIEPTEVRLCRSSDGAILQVLGRGSVPAARDYGMSRWERITIPTRDGITLDGSLLKPVPFDSDQRYPVWIPTYSGPRSPSVRERWNSSAWYQFLAQHGVIVMQVNVRSASHAGRAVVGQAYKRMGVLEVRDMEDAVDWLCQNPWADQGRVGISGHSYGGFMTARCMLTSDRFRLGVAGSGVYDWRMYDTIYTERYMSTPQLNPEGYQETSCLPQAKNLRGFLHLSHGLMDDNVHVQQLFHLTDALQQAGKTNWSMMVYANSRHGISGLARTRHARQITWDLIQEHLAPPVDGDEARESEQAFEAQFGGPESSDD